MCGCVYLLSVPNFTKCSSSYSLDTTIILKPEESSSLLVYYFVFCSIMVLMFPGSITVTSELQSKRCWWHSSHTRLHVHYVVNDWVKLRHINTKFYENLSTALNFEMECMHPHVYTCTHTNMHTEYVDLMSLFLFAKEIA